MTAEVHFLRTRRERAADAALVSVEGLREAVDGLRDMAAAATRVAARDGTMDEASAAFGRAAALVIEAGDALALYALRSEKQGAPPLPEEPLVSAPP